MIKLHLVNMLFAALLVILPDTYAAPQARSILSVLQGQKQTNTPDALTSSEPNKRSKRSDGYLPYEYPTYGELPHVHPHIHPHPHLQLPHLQLLPHLNLRKHPRIQLRKHKHPRFPLRQNQPETHLPPLPPPPPTLRPLRPPPTDFDMTLNIGNIFGGLLSGFFGLLGH